MTLDRHFQGERGVLLLSKQLSSPTAESLCGNLDSICEKRRAQRMFKRCEHPQLPQKNSFYGAAKRLEYSGDIKGALVMYHQAIINGDRPDSSMKDIAGILNMMGKTSEAVDFLKANEKFVDNKLGFVNLLNRLESEKIRENEFEIGEGDGNAVSMPRSVLVTIEDRSVGCVSLSLCDRLFPNPGKIRRILLCDEGGYIGAVQFATHSAARKAVHVKKLVESVTACWASDFDEARLRELEKKEEEKKNVNELECGQKLNIFNCVEEVPKYLASLADVGAIPVYSMKDDVVALVTAEVLISKHGKEKNQDIPDKNVSEERNNKKVTVEGKTEIKLLNDDEKVFALRGLPFVSLLGGDKVNGMKIPAIVFPLPDCDITTLPREPTLLTQYVIASAHSVLAAQTVAVTLQNIASSVGNDEFQDAQSHQLHLSPSSRSINLACCTPNRSTSGCVSKRTRVSPKEESRKSNTSFASFLSQRSSYSLFAGTPSPIVDRSRFS